MQQKENFDPMREFWTRFFPFLFRQAPVIVFMSVVVSVMWLKLGNMENQARLDRFEIRRECSQSIADVRQELRACQSENDTFRGENIILKARVSALEKMILKSKR